MPRSDEFAGVTLDVNAGAQPVVAEPTEETPFRIMVAGDFSGRGSRERAPGRRQLKPVVIDRDNFDEVMAGMGMHLRLGREGDEGATLRFRELDDFHPDRIYQSLDVFRELRAMRGSLEGASSGSEAIAKVRAWAGLSGGKASQPAQTSLSAPERRPEEMDPLPLTGGNLLDDVLEASERDAPSGWTPPRDPLQSFIQKALAPHLAPREDPQAPELLTRLDEAAGTLMRAILHGKEFQALEAVWRALFLMIRRLETGSLLKVYLLDMTRAELEEDIQAGALEESALYRLLVGEVAKDPDHVGWAVVAGHFSFDQSERDTGLLQRLGRLARAAGAPFLAEGDLGGGRAAAEDAGPWGALRRSAEASWLGLALPRYLLRLPYGKKTDAVESFRFEEIPGVPAHGDYLWGNPALACAYLLGEAFSQDGWQMRPGAAREISDMPLHVYEESGEAQLRPCVELALTPSEAEWALDAGYMPLIWLRGHDSIRLVRFQSIADPAAPLSGRWG
jgi:type VI secretion system protein ImpC